MSLVDRLDLGSVFARLASLGGILFPLGDGCAGCHVLNVRREQAPCLVQPRHAEAMLPRVWAQNLFDACA